MGVSFGRPRVSELGFQVLAKAVHPDWFTVRAHRRISYDAWEADVRIIDEGHAVSFRSGAVRLTEVLAGPETLLPEAGRLFHSAVRHERSTTLEPGGLIVYQTCFEVERVDPEVFAHLCEEIVLDASRGRMIHQSAPANRMAPAPISHIYIDSRVKGLTVHAFHTFPGEWAIVRSQSLFELHAPLPRR